MHSHCLLFAEYLFKDTKTFEANYLERHSSFRELQTDRVNKLCPVLAEIGIVVYVCYFFMVKL